MKITTIKQYENDYYVSFGYNGAQFNRSEDSITKDVTRTGNSLAHESFILDTNRYRSIPTPEFEDCKFQVLSVAFSEENKYRIYTLKIQVTWQYTKE